MNRMKYRIWLMIVALAATVFGIFYYIYQGNEKKTITDATLVYRMEEYEEEEAAA